MSQKTLRAAAFGGDPGTWPLPRATTAHQRWLRAVAAGGQGRYGSARADLAVLLRERATGSLASLAHSTQASFLRQLGWHALARGWDGRALALAGEDPEAAADALIGLAADALGVGRFAAAATLLTRSSGMLKHAPPRLAVRQAWVAAELAMAAGDGAAALRHAEQAVQVAHTATADSARHLAKTEVVLAAALCCTGALDRARQVADAALENTGRLGLIPLRWALASLLADIGSAAHPAPDIVGLRDACADLVRRRGGTWRDR
ncbi:hypothetical protein ACAG26_01255 [Mycobacterium sp. pUA109]|uniref:hypothetical protein n=1 Tax=Mycobacterium sp. pUA109 TaxID=3238982 RepID=UPI00351B3A38